MNCCRLELGGEEENVFLLAAGLGIHFLKPTLVIFVLSPVMAMKVPRRDLELLRSGDDLLPFGGRETKHTRRLRVFGGVQWKSKHVHIGISQIFAQGRRTAANDRYH